MFLFSPKFCISCISSWLSYVQLDTTTIFVVGPTLLLPHWQWCAKGCNNSQQCWDLQCTMGRVQLIRLWRPWLCNACAWPQQCWESCANSIVALRFGDHRTKMLGVVCSKVWPVSTFVQQHPTTCNRVCKWMHHVTFNVQCWKLLANNVASVCTGLYSGSSPKGHSCEWTALLTAAFSKPVFLTSHTNSVLNSCKQPAPVTDTFFVFWGCPLESFHCS